MVYYTTKIINKNNIDSIFDRKIMDNITKSFGSVFGTGISGRQGIVQDLNRNSLLATTSHIRRLVTPLPPGSKTFGPRNFQIPCRGYKLPFWQFFREGQDGRALLVRPSRIPHKISKILFASGADDFLPMLEGKIREGPFFKGSIW